jgi:hypothetical protein
VPSSLNRSGRSRRRFGSDKNVRIEKLESEQMLKGVGRRDGVLQALVEPLHPAGTVAAA